MSLKITFSDSPLKEELKVIEDGYQAYTERFIGEDGSKEVAFFLRDEHENVCGGVKAVYGNYGWLWVDTLWISDEHRGQGYGEKLMAHVEREAKLAGCTNAYLNSFSFQAVEFYKKLGYRVFGQLSDFPPGHSVSCLTKAL